MKTFICKSLNLLVITGSLVASNILYAQTAEVTKATAPVEGTVSEFGPQSIIIQTAFDIKPVRYLFNETTSYVDEEDQPIDYAMIKFGLPVIVYYVRVGDALIASKVIVRKMATSPASTPSTEKIAIYLDENGRALSINNLKPGLHALAAPVLAIEERKAANKTIIDHPPATEDEEIEATVETKK